MFSLRCCLLRIATIACLCLCFQINLLQAEAPVHIAANLPLSGDLATYGTSILEGAELALKDLGKDAEGLIFDWQDNRGLPREAVSIAMQQLIDNPDIYISGVKPQTMAIQEQVQKAGLPIFPWVFDIHARKISPLAFRAWVNFKIEPPLFLNYAKKIDAKRIAIIYVQLPHTDEEFLDVVVPGLRKGGIKEIMVDGYQMNKMDFKDIAVRLLQFKPDLLILSGFQANLVGMIKAFRQHGLIKEGNTISSYDMLDVASLLSVGELEGIRASTPSFMLHRDNPKLLKWKESFRSLYHKEPLYTHAYAYDMALAIADAVKRVPEKASHDEWKDAIQKTKLEGITGPLEFDSDGDIKTPVELGVFRKGVVEAE